MKRLLLVLGIVVVISLAGLFAYKVYLPKMIAEGITDEAPYLMPDEIREKLEVIKRPVNQGALVVVETAQKSGITMEQLFRAIDNATEEQADAMLAELNKTDLQSTDEVFTMAKKHFPVDFDVEVFRKPFTQNVDLATVKRAIRHAIAYREKDEFDVETAKSIAKQVLLQKEEEIMRLTQAAE